MTQARTLYRKIVDAHTVKTIDSDTVLLYCDAHFANEYTSPQAFAGVAARGLPVLSPDSHLCVVSHIIPSRDESPRRIYDAASLKQAETLEANCRRFGIKAFFGANDPDQGLEHVVMAERGLVRPGMVVICGDSHTTSHGALGALGFGVGTSEIEHILATETLVYRLASSMKITIRGKLSHGATAKDLALYVLRKISAGGALGCVVEYEGEAIGELSVEGRITLCNLTVEAGARGALIAPDQKTVDWVLAHAPELQGDEKAAALAYWKTLKADPDAEYERTVEIDASVVRPTVTWGTSPDQNVFLDEAVPSPESFSDPVEREAAERRSENVGRFRRLRLHRLLHERASPRPRRGRRSVEGPPSGAGRQGHGRPRFHAHAPRRGSPGARRRLQGRGIRVEKARLLALPCDERRRSGERRTLCGDHEPQL